MKGDTVLVWCSYCFQSSDPLRDCKGLPVWKPDGLMESIRRPKSYIHLCMYTNIYMYLLTFRFMITCLHMFMVDVSGPGIWDYKIGNY